MQGVPVEPYIEDCGWEVDTPRAWAVQDNLRKWGLILARDGQKPLGGAVVGIAPDLMPPTQDPPGLFVLWDIRLRRPEYGRLRIPLFRTAVRWASPQGFQQMRIETRNVNPGRHSWSHVKRVPGGSIGMRPWMFFDLCRIG